MSTSQTTNEYKPIFLFMPKVLDYAVLAFWHLPPSLASAAATRELQDNILPEWARQHCDADRNAALEIWKTTANTSQPAHPADRSIQKV